MDLEVLKEHRVKVVTSFVTFYQLKGFSSDTLEEKTEKTAERLLDEAGNVLSHQVWPFPEPPVETSFAYDANNRLIEKKIHTSGDPDQRYTFEYDESGNLLKEFTHYEMGDPDVMRHEYENGKAIRGIAKDEDGEVEHERTMAYDDAGRLLSETKFGYGQEEDKTENQYDEQGRKTSIRAYYGGELQGETEITYLEKTEQVAKQVITSANGEETTTTFTYIDSQQLIQEQRAYTPSGQEALLKFAYDARGLQTEIEETHQAPGRAVQTIRRTFNYEFYS